MTKNIGISGTPEEIKIIGTLLELEGYKNINNEYNPNSLLTYPLLQFGVYLQQVNQLCLTNNYKIFKASEFDKAYQYLFDKELFSAEYFKTYYKKLSIQCNSQEEYDNILKAYPLKNFKKNYYPIYKTNTCINIGDSAYCILEYYLEHEYKVIPADFVLQFKSEKMNKKIIGYKLNSNLNLNNEKVGAILGDSGAVNSKGFYFTFEDIERNVSCFKRAKELAVLDTWFIPVYEKDEVVLNIGNPTQRVLINKDGVTCEGKTMDFFDLQMIKGRIDNSRSTETWIMEVSEIKIGCSKFSIEEFEQVIEASKKFKS